MPCPNCSHTMANLGLNDGGKRTFWCSRCGCLKTETPTFEEHQAPKWTKPVDGAPDTLNLLGLLYKVVAQGALWDSAKRYLDGRHGECEEAVARMEAALVGRRMEAGRK